MGITIRCINKKLRIITILYYKTKSKKSLNSIWGLVEYMKEGECYEKTESSKVQKRRLDSLCCYYCGNEFKMKILTYYSI